MKRYRHKDRFGCSTAYLEVDENRDVYLVGKDGTRKKSHAFTAEECEGFVRDGVWIELPPQPQDPDGLKDQVEFAVAHAFREALARWLPADYDLVRQLAFKHGVRTRVNVRGCGQGIDSALVELTVNDGKVVKV